jgi:hypothetical protein
MSTLTWTPILLTLVLAGCSGSAADGASSADVTHAQCGDPVVPVTETSDAHHVLRFNLDPGSCIPVSFAADGLEDRQADLQAALDAWDAAAGGALCFSTINPISSDEFLEPPPSFDPKIYVGLGAPPTPGPPNQTVTHFHEENGTIIVSQIYLGPPPLPSTLDAPAPQLAIDFLGLVGVAIGLHRAAAGTDTVMAPADDPTKPASPSAHDRKAISDLYGGNCYPNNAI